MIKKIIILKPKKSLNFSESCNAGIVNSDSDKVFIANDDIIISKGTLENLSANTDDQTITGPDSNCNLGFQSDYAYTVGGVRLVPAMVLDQIKEIIPEIYDIKTVRSDNVPRDWLAFFATMFTRKCLNDVGLLDETFVYDREDLDWCVRAQQKGKKFSTVFSSYCFHFGGISRKRKHAELGLKHDLDQEHNLIYFQNKYGQKTKPVLAFYCHDAWEYWDENSMNKSLDPKKPSGIGGSETQVILLSRELAKLGWKVKVFNKCLENHMDSCGLDVEYIPFQNFEEFSKLLTYDVLIASRYLECFNVPFKSKRNIAMIHDVFLILGSRNQLDVKQDKIDKYLCLSNSHKHFVSGHHGIPLEKIVMTSNGLDLKRFNQEVQKNRYKMVYSSSPDRGLEVLLDLFPRVKKEIPEVTLDIYYGFENFRDQEYVKKMLEKINSTEGVFYRGRIGQDELAQKFMEAGIWAYPTWFEETYCCLPETKIKSDVGYIPIEDSENKSVLTHKGNIRKVKELLKRDVETQAKEIKVSYLKDKIRITKEHPVYLLERKFVKRKKEKKYNPIWAAVENAKKGDYLCFPLNKNKNTPSSFIDYSEADIKDNVVYHAKTKANKFNNFTIDKDFLELCGWYVSEGSFDGKSIISFSLNKSEEAVGNFIEEQLKKLNLQVRKDTVENSLSVVTSSVILGEFFTKNFGFSAKTKIIPQWVKDLDEDYLKHFLKGVILGDGCRDRDTLAYECASESLVMDLFEVFLKFKCVSSTNNSFKKKPIKKGNEIIFHSNDKLPAFRVCTTMKQNRELFKFFGYETIGNSGGTHGFFDEDNLYLPIKDIKTFDYKGTVYNLEVDEDNSYVASGVSVHNCITALEAMAGGAIPVTSSYWGLIDTLGDAGITLPMPQGRQTVHHPEYQKSWVDACIRLLRNPEYFEEIQKKGFERVARFTWEAVAKQWDRYFKTEKWEEIQ